MSQINKIEKLLHEGYNFFLQKNYLNSLKLFKKALKFDIEYSKTLYLIGLNYASTNNPEEAKKYFFKSLLKDPNNFYINYNLAKSLSELDKDNESIKYHTKAIKIDSKNFEAWLNLGVSQKKLKKYDDAIISFKKSILLNPNDGKPFSNLGEIFTEIKDYKTAKNYFENALNIDPKSSENITNLGVVYKNLKDFKKSINYHLQAIKIDGNYAEAYSNLGITYRRIFEYDKAIQNLNKAIKINPNLESAWINKGLILADTNNYNDAKICYEKVIQLNNKNPDVYLNLSLLELSNRKFENGWKFYEKRWSTRKFQKYVNSEKKAWNGKEKLNSLLIVSEQGLGDQILYASMFKEVNKYSKKISLLSDPKLVSVFKRSFPNFEIISRSNFDNEKSVDFFDSHIAMGSLGQYFRKNINDFNKNQPPYIIDNKDLTFNLEKKVKENKKLICGITWLSKNEDIGLNKSIDLKLLSPILENKKIKFINLQYGNVGDLIKEYNNSSENKIVSIPSVDLTDDIDSSISLIKNCDFILSISNTTAHLAGSINKDVLLLAPKNIGKLHYWSSNTDRSLWYPSIKVFKQEENYNWDITLSAVNTYIRDHYF